MKSTQKSKPRKQAGRPRKDGKPNRQRRKAVPWSIRPQIHQLISDGVPISQIVLKFKRHNISKSQIENIKKGKTKLVKSVRTDSKQHSDATVKSTTLKGTLPEKMETNLHRALDLLTNGRKPVAARFTMLVKAGQVAKNIQSMQLISKLGRLDAEVILMLVRLFKPDATEDDCIKHYKQAEILVKTAQSD